jgi:mannose-6-phosphate isomerase-like protein (cupin superfamily)
MDAVLHAPGEGEQLSIGATSTTIKADGARTAGTFFLAETRLEPGFPGPPPHVHERLHDMFYVLEGALTMRLGDRTVALASGAFACVPPGVVHTFRNDGDTPVRFLNFNTPAGWEGYMRDLAGASAERGTLLPAEIGAIASRYDFRVVAE